MLQAWEEIYNLNSQAWWRHSAQRPKGVVRMRYSRIYSLHRFVCIEFTPSLQLAGVWVTIITYQNLKPMQHSIYRVLHLSMEIR